MDWTPVGLFSKYFGASLADDPESGVHCTAGENQCPVCGEGAAQPLLATEGQSKSGSPTQLILEAKVSEAGNLTRCCAGLRTGKVLERKGAKQRMRTNSSLPETQIGRS